MLAAPIQSLSSRAIRAALRDALANDAPVLAVCDLVASVDWSGMDGAAEDVKRLLGELEHLTTEVAEGDVDAAAFLDRAVLIASAEYALAPGP